MTEYLFHMHICTNGLSSADRAQFFLLLNNRNGNPLTGKAYGSTRPAGPAPIITVFKFEVAFIFSSASPMTCQPILRAYSLFQEGLEVIETVHTNKLIQIFVIG